MECFWIVAWKLLFLPISSGDPFINIKSGDPKYRMNLVSAWLQQPSYAMGYPVMKNYLPAKTYQYLFPRMVLTLASIMYVEIMNLILGVMNIIPAQYLLANGIKDDLMILLVIVNRVHSSWALLMCHLLISFSAVVEECLSLDMKDFKGHSCYYFNVPSFFNSLTVLFVL